MKCKVIPVYNRDRLDSQLRLKHIFACLNYLGWLTQAVLDSFQNPSSPRFPLVLETKPPKLAGLR